MDDPALRLPKLFLCILRRLALTHHPGAMQVSLREDAVGFASRASKQARRLYEADLRQVGG